MANKLGSLRSHDAENGETCDGYASRSQNTTIFSSMLENCRVWFDNRALSGRF